VFAGGIGEHSALLRRHVVKECECLGFHLDENKNDSLDGNIVDLSFSTGIDKKVLVVKTNEEREMVKQLLLLLHER
jgi:acetate kinase